MKKPRETALIHALITTKQQKKPYINRSQRQASFDYSKHARTIRYNNDELISFSSTLVSPWFVTVTNHKDKDYHHYVTWQIQDKVYSMISSSSMLKGMTQRGTCKKKFQHVFSFHECKYLYKTKLCGKFLVFRFKFAHQTFRIISVNESIKWKYISFADACNCSMHYFVIYFHRLKYFCILLTCYCYFTGRCREWWSLWKDHYSKKE